MSKVYQKHGYAINGASPTYRRWYQMIRRCHDPRIPDYKYYGARGIKVCDKWRKSIKNFVEDMGEMPEGMTLDRIDNNKNYCKKNCRWATRKEQRANQRLPINCTKITFEGKTQTIAAWAREKGIKYITLHARITRYKMPIDKAMKP